MDLTLSNIFAPTYLPGAAQDAYKIIQKRAKYKNDHHREAVEAQGRNFMPWLRDFLRQWEPESCT